MSKIKRELNDALVDDLREAERLILRSEYAAYLDLKQLFDTHRNAAPELTSEARARFEALFTRYYGLNSAGVTKDFKKRFFQILFDADDSVKAFENDKPNYSGVLAELYKIKRLKNDRALQVSFVSKLAAMHNESCPIYDQYVREYLNITLPINGKSAAQVRARITWFTEMLEEIKGAYVDWVRDPRIRAILMRFAKRDPELAKCHVVRQLDFLVWQAGKLEAEKKKRARDAKKEAAAN